MKIDYKTKGNIAGYVAVLVLFLIAGLTFYLTVMDIHFECDVFIMLLLMSIFESCRATYIDYRKKEIDELLTKPK